MTNKQAAIRIIRILRENGHRALLAGGCVRDMMLNRRPKDYDVATSAHPEQIIKLFRRTLKIGAQFGVVMVMMDNQQVEVATFRSESGYADGRHPDRVDFSTAKQDAVRRDFTINGMFYDPVEKEVIDYVSGRKDLEKKIIRTIGDPAHRFGEDYLRMLRAVRFSVQLDFDIEPDTWASVIATAKKISSISSERIAIEIESVLTHPDRARGLGLLSGSGLIQAIFKDFDGNRVEVAVEVLGRLPQRVTFPLSIAALFVDLDVEDAVNYCRALKLSNLCIKHVSYLLQNRGVLLDADMPLSSLKRYVSSPYYRDLYRLEKAVLQSKGQNLSALNRIRERALQLKGRNLTPRPLLDGHELISLGVQPGPMVGLAAEQMYIGQLNETLKTPDDARKFITKWLREHKNA